MNQSFDTELRESYNRHAAPYLLEEQLDELVVSGKGATLHCASGRVLIDMASGGFGYSHPTVGTAVEAQIKKAPLSSRILINRSLAMLVQRLAEVTPGDLTVSYICNSGEEALDSALKLVKGYTPNKKKIVVASGCDYGTLSHATYFAGIGANYLSGLPFLPVSVPFGDTDATLRAIDDTTAAVLLPSINLNNGMTTATSSFWSAVRTRCDETKALLIVDERHTALGHTGTNFAVKHYGIVPDVIILGNALGGGYISIGAYVTKECINSQVYGKRNPTLHGSTTGANPASCVAALGALEVMETENLAERHSTFETILHHKLSKLQLSYPEAIAQINICGGLAAVAFADIDLARDVRNQSLRQNLLLRQPNSQWLLLRPPLTISAIEFNQALTVLGEAIVQSAAPLAAIAESGKVTNTNIVKEFA